eukprot:scaffold3836_cov125-Isochrysis_galbana.AAC.1
MVPKTNYPLSTTLFLANQAKIDALLVQEIHYYEDGTHLRVANMAKHREGGLPSSHTIKQNSARAWRVTMAPRRP